DHLLRHVPGVGDGSALAVAGRGKFLAGEVRGELAHLRRVGATRMQHRAAAPVDGAGVGAVERDDVVRPALRVLEIDVGETLPAAPEPDHLEVVLAAAVGDALDHCVEAGHVAAAGQNPDAPFAHGPPLAGRTV